jgi:FlaA1/EpsC-like NDP-sugar epimerase
MAERLVIQANGLSETRFSVMRSGNIMGSSNSVIPLFISQLAKNNKIMMTSGEMTRFFIYLQDLITLMTSDEIKSGLVFIPQMSSFNLGDLARKIIAKYGNKESKIIETGILPGEKLHEILFTRQELPQVKFDRGYWIGGKGTPIHEIQCSMDRVTLNYVV